jgi:hypothetical protein
MDVGTMSFSEGYGKDYGELLEYDNEASLTFGDSGGLSSSRRTGGGRSKSSSVNSQSPPQMIDRFSNTRGMSEMSMDLSDLQDVLEEEDSSSRSAQGSMFSNNLLSDGPAPSCHQHQHQHQQQQQHQLNHLVSVQEDADRKSDDDDDSYSKRRRKNDSNNSTIEFDEIPEGFFQQNSSPIATTNEHRQGNKQEPLLSVDEQGESEGSFLASSLAASQESSSLNVNKSSNGSLNSRRKVKFEISTRLEDIQEFEKPGVEDYHKLYYTAHELQKMIDSHRAEERNERYTVR